MKKWNHRFRKPKQIYIIPTQLGFIFMGSFCAMLLIAAAYSNNLIYLLAFLLFSIFLVTMVQTHHTIKSLKLVGVHLEPGFAEDTIRGQIDLQNIGSQSMQNIRATFEDLELIAFNHENIFLRPSAIGHFASSYKAGVRGRRELTWIRVGTRFPLGLFKSWTFIPIKAEVYVYPKPAGAQLSPQGSHFLESNSGQVSSGVEDFYGHRRLEKSEPTRHVDWKAYARTQRLMTKQFSDFQQPALELDDRNLKHLDIEERLSQLTLWITQAQNQNLPYSLRIQNNHFPVQLSKYHQRRCLELLATYRERP